MLGTWVNVAAILAGGGIGLLLKKGLPKRLADTLMKALGLCTLYIGISGCLAGENTLVLILSMVFGTFIGEGLDLDDKINRLGKFLERKFQKEKKGEKQEKNKVSLAEGFVTASLLFCVGAMAIVGSLQSGLSGQHETLFAKSVLDFTSAIIFASSLGAGVLLSSGFVLVYQGSITLLAQFLKPLLTEPVIAEMNCVGNVIIIGLALNMLGITKLKVMNFVPAILLPVVLCLFFS